MTLVIVSAQKRARSLLRLRSRTLGAGKILSLAAVFAGAVLAPALAHAEPASQTIEWHRFLNAPTHAGFETVYTEVKACTDYTTCQHPSKPTTEDADKLAALISKKKVFAVRLAFASFSLLSENDEGYDDVLPMYGPFIRAFPRKYLSLARDEGMPDEAVAAAAAATPDQMNDDYAKQLRELTARRAALSKVEDADLAAVRDLCLVSVDRMIYALTPAESAPRS